jgi:regulator of RNase E activity RraA
VRPIDDGTLLLSLNGRTLEDSHWHIRDSIIILVGVPIKKGDVIIGDDFGRIYFEYEATHDGSYRLDIRTVEEKFDDEVHPG